MMMRIKQALLLGGYIVVDFNMEEIDIQYVEDLAKESEFKVLGYYNENKPTTAVGYYNH